MTTNHRPTLESRRGRQLDANSITHARALPAHKQLKFRSLPNTAEAREKLQELRRDLEQREKKHYGGDKMIEGAPEAETGEKEEKEEESYAEKRRRIEKEAASVDDSDDSSDEEKEEKHRASDDSEQDGSASESESDSDDSDDEAALLAELQKIKRERAEQQRQQELDAKKEAALTSNPLLNTTSGAKKSWRQTSVFRNKQSTVKKDEKDAYVNDALRSDFHKRFLDRYIK